MIRSRLYGVIGIILSSALFTVLALLEHIPIIASLYQLAFLLTVPGLLLATLLGLRRSGKLLFSIYAFSLSLFTLLVGGLLINTLLPLVGVERPLTLGPLLIFYDLLILGLTIAWGMGRRWALPVARLSVPRPKLRQLLVLAVPITAAILSVVGATSLNNNSGNHFTLTMLGLVGLFIIYIGFKRKKIDGWVYAASLFFLGAALLFMYSLRSWHIIGADVNQEFQVFSMVLEQAQWFARSTFATEYNACLSITILPTELAVFTHLTPEYIYKFLMQLVFAMAPVMVFALARNIVKTKWAFFAGFAFAAQTWFIEQMPALIRQEVALLFFMAAIIVLLDRALAWWQQWTLFGLFTAGAIMSHYSTAYVYIALLLVALLISYGARFIMRVPKDDKPRLTISKLLLALVLIVLWEGAITAAGGSFTVFAKNAVNHAAKAFTAESLSSSVSQLTFSGAGVHNAENLRKDYTTTTMRYAEKPDFDAYPAAATKQYTPVLTDDIEYVKRDLPAYLTKPLLLLGRVSKLLIVNVLSIIGLAVLLWRLKRSDPHVREYTYLALAGVPLLVGIIFLPIASSSYNTTRLFLQTYILLAGPAILAAYLVHRWIGARKAAMLAGALLAMFFWYSSSFMGQLLGGAPASITMNQPGGIFDSYYVHDGEVEAAKWLSLNREPGIPVYADSMAALRLQSFGNIKEVNTDIFPATISQDSYVYLNYPNVTRGLAYRSYENGVLVYDYPVEFLKEHKDLIYSNGTTEIYR